MNISIFREQAPKLASIALTLLSWPLSEAHAVVRDRFECTSEIFDVHTHKTIKGGTRWDIPRRSVTPSDLPAQYAYTQSRGGTGVSLDMGEHNVSLSASFDILHAYRFGSNGQPTEARMTSCNTIAINVCNLFYGECTSTTPAPCPATDPFAPVNGWSPVPLSSTGYGAYDSSQALMLSGDIKETREHSARKLGHYNVYCIHLGTVEEAEAK